jgi:hypothetical protein
MTLPSSGPISSSMINTELGRSSTAVLALKTASDGGYVVINRNSAVGLTIYNNSLSGIDYSPTAFYSYDHTTNTLFDYNFTNNASFDIDNLVIDFGTGNQVVNIATLNSNGGNNSNSNIDTTKTGGGWYVYFANNPASGGTLVDIEIYDVDTGTILYSLTGATANNYNGQSIGPTIEYYRHIGLTLNYLDP